MRLDDLVCRWGTCVPYRKKHRESKIPIDVAALPHRRCVRTNTPPLLSFLSHTTCTPSHLPWLRSLDWMAICIDMPSLLRLEVDLSPVDFDTLFASLLAVLPPRTHTHMVYCIVYLFCK
ncbi:hypothetical protein GQ607_001256 [Colletotrichum asianum]|uniref:Uncharacterized protein n=1 Tax=Colletotrichum asianum TaxID=702518 RepID=A0A8H3ZYW6_9PEZI|nr:hypothetical protein GQ607_001256 [Colletotrichum asianum]